jgi:hypothetical protein
MDLVPDHRALLGVDVVSHSAATTRCTCGGRTSPDTCMIQSSSTCADAVRTDAATRNLSL